MTYGVLCIPPAERGALPAAAIPDRAVTLLLAHLFFSPALVLRFDLGNVAFQVRPHPVKAFGYARLPLARGSRPIVLLCFSACARASRCAWVISILACASFTAPLANAFRLLPLHLCFGKFSHALPDALLRLGNGRQARRVADTRGDTGLLFTEHARE